MKKLTLGLILGSFMIFPATQTLCMSRLGAVGALAAAAVATQCKKAATISGSNNKNSFNGNTKRFNGDENPGSFNDNTNCFNGGVYQHTYGPNGYQHTYKSNGGEANQYGFININNGYCISICGITILGGKPHQVIGSGNRTKKTTPITGSPSQVDVSFGNLSLELGKESSLVVEADDNIHGCLKQVVSASAIKLGVQENCSFLPKNPIDYTLTLQKAPIVLRASGSSTITTPSMEPEQMKLVLSGASKIYIPALKTKKLTADVSGASMVTINNGAADNQQVTCSGASSYNAAGLESVMTEVDCSGASYGAVHAQHVTGHASGASKIAIHGRNFGNVDISTSGASRWFFA